MRWCWLVVALGAVGGCTVLFDPSPPGGDGDGGLSDVCEGGGASSPWLRGAGSGGDQDGAGVAAFAGGCVSICGTFNESFSLGPEAELLMSEGGSDGYVGLLDPDGALLWSQRFGDGEDQSCDAVASHQGVLAAAGTFEGILRLGEEERSAGSARDVYVGLLAGGGAPIWLQQIGGNSGGGAAPSLAVGEEVYVAGEIDAPAAVGLDGTSGGGFVAARGKAGGELQWATLFPRATVDDDVIAEAVDVNEEGVLVAGQASNGFTVEGSDCELGDTGGERVAFVARLSLAGDCLWLEDIRANRAWAFAARFGPDGEVIVAGRLDGALDSAVGSGLGTAAGDGLDGFVARYTENGDASWLWRLGGTDTTSEVRLDTVAAAEDRIYAAGFLRGTATTEAASLTSAGTNDALLVTLASSGSVVNAELSGDSSDQAVQSLAVSEGRPVLRGYFQGTLEWERPTPLESKGGRDAFTLVLPPR